MIKKILLSILLIIAAFSLISASNPPPTPASADLQVELFEAFTRRLQENPADKSITFDLFTPELDTAFISLDGKTAVLWLALRDDYGRILATEPGLVLATSTSNGWQIILPGDNAWDTTMAAIPQDMLPVEKQSAPSQPEMDAVIAEDAHSGYYLPYAAGTSRWLEGSISHFQSIPELGYPSCTIEYCRYAFDFTDQTHFPLLASKAGTVFASRDTCSDGNEGCTNYMVLQNSSDGTYQIYLHMAHGTIPDKLTPGRSVQRGEYLGDSDDTGYSTSNHVHFMVTTSVWVGGDGYYWGRSIEIHFSDVTINNGIPRTCYEVTSFPIYDGATQCLGNRSDPRNPSNDWFTSGNIGAYPPTGNLTRPADGAIVTSGQNPLIDVTATTSDDVGVTAVRLMAKLNNQWVEIGPRITQPAQSNLFDWDVNLCDVGPLNGALEVGLRVWDYEGNRVGPVSTRTIQVDHACPAPVSQMTAATTFESTALRLNWQLMNAGIGINSYQMQWRMSTGIWDSANILTFPNTQFSSWFSGQAGMSYLFRVRAVDINGQLEPWPAGDAAEITVTLPATCSVDSSEPDNNANSAKNLQSGEIAQRNLCPTADQDWFRVELAAGNYYLVRAVSLNGGAAVKMAIFTENGQTQLANSQSPGLAQDSSLLLKPSSSGFYTIKIEPLVTNLMGTDAVYQLQFMQVLPTFLPLINR